MQGARSSLGRSLPSYSPGLRRSKASWSGPSAHCWRSGQSDSKILKVRGGATGIEPVPDNVKVVRDTNFRVKTKRKRPVEVQIGA